MHQLRYDPPDGGCHTRNSVVASQQYCQKVNVCFAHLLLAPSEGHLKSPERANQMPTPRFQPIRDRSDVIAVRSPLQAYGSIVAAP